MIQRLIIIISVLLLYAGCFEENITTVSDSILINSSYSLPIGEVVYKINEYFEALDTVHLPMPDSVAYNDTIYPNVLHIVEKIDLKQFIFASHGGSSDKIRSVTFRLIIQNSYPTEARAQIYFTYNQSVIDSMFENGKEIIPPASIDQNGIVVEPSITMKDIYASQAIVNDIGYYTNIEIHGEVLTTRPDIRIVKFYPEYELRIHIGTRIEIEYNFNDLY
ncbi:MAG TPA: hypothetical protein VJ346_00880 [Bacteroidales bacterium]|nr:hypothetical protein [Bacteroidales bacterium]